MNKLGRVKTANRRDLVKAYCEATGSTQREAFDAIAGLVRAMQSELVRGNDVTLTGLVTLYRDETNHIRARVAKGINGNVR